MATPFDVSRTGRGGGGRQQFVRERFRPLVQAQQAGAARQFLGARASSLLPSRTVGGASVVAPSRQLSGNRSFLRAGLGRLASAEELDFGVDRVEGLSSSDFDATDLFLTGEQQTNIERVSRTAAGRGLRGGAVRSQVQNLTQKFLTTNRAQGFANVTQAAGSAFDRLQGSSQAFLGQVEQLSRGVDAGGLQGLAVGTAGTDDLRQFAQPLIQALKGLGQERSLAAGLLLGQDVNADLTQFNLSNQEFQIAQAVQQFLNPGLNPEQRSNVESRRRRFGGLVNEGVKTGRAAGELSASREQAGQFLGQVVRAPLQSFRAARDELRGGSQALGAFLTQGFLAGGRRVTAANLRREFGGAFATTGGGFRSTPQVGNFGVRSVGII